MRKLFFIFLVLFLPLVWTGAQTAQDQKSRKARLEEEINLIEKQIKETSSRNSSALDKLTLIRSKIKTREKLLAESEKEIFALNDSINRKVREIRRLQERLDTMTLYYNRLVKNAYKNRDARIWYMYLLSSGSIAQAGRRFGYLRSLSSQMSAQGRKIKETKADIEADLERLKKMRVKAKALMQSHKLGLESLKSEQAQNEKLVVQLKKQKSKYQKELSSKKRQVEALNREIESIINSQLNGGKTNAEKKGSSLIDYKLSGEFETNKGNLPWPCPGSIIGHFGNRTHPVYKLIKLPFNNGIDILVSKDSPIKAVFNGEVKKIIVMPGYNKCVLIQHGKYFTFYCKLGSVNVKAGEKVKAGQTLGTVDTIDGQTQLHFQLWSGTEPQNPENWLRRY